MFGVLYIMSCYEVCIIIVRIFIWVNKFVVVRFKFVVEIVFGIFCSIFIKYIFCWNGIKGYRFLDLIVFFILYGVDVFYYWKFVVYVYFVYFFL